MLRGEGEKVVMGVSVSSYISGGDYVDWLPPRKIKWHACALSLTQANAPSFTPNDIDLAFQMRPLSHH